MLRTRKFLVFVLALLMLIPAACSQAADPVVNISESDAGKTIELKKGDTLVVTLQGNITTGYNWEMEAATAPAFLQQVGEPEVTPESGLVGAGGKIALKFSAVQTGQATMKLVYHRAWEKGVAPAKTYEVKLVVK